MVERSPKYLSSREVTILGYAHARSVAKQPTFMFKEFCLAMTAADKEFTSSVFVPPIGKLATGKCLQRQRLPARDIVGPHRGVNDICSHQITDKGKSTLLTSLEFHVRRNGVTLPEILVLPDSVEAVVKHTTFMDDLSRHIRGEG